MGLKVVIAPDKFAGTLTAAEAADAMGAGWSAARPDDHVVLAPMADGGEGMTDVVADVVEGAVRGEATVADARGVATTAAWLSLPDGRVLLECAQACGLSGLAEDQRDPRLTTTYGVGQLLAAAREAGAREIVIGLGGSATNDGGAGMATALGHRLLRADGNGIKVGGAFLAELGRIVVGEPFGVPIVAAVDVTNPLLGPDGATAVFGPQKGAGGAVLAELEEALTRLADVAERDLDGGPWRDLAGAGAAGGLGFGLMAFCGAKVRRGAEVVAELVGFTEAVSGADLVLTGEGSLDAQSASGKAPRYVLETARANGARVLAVAGRVEAGAAQDFDAARDLGPRGMEAAAELVTERTRGLAEEVAG
jgi:glycerate kinase